MLCYNTAPNGVANQGGIQMVGGGTYLIPWCPTGRTANPTAGGTPGSVFNAATRTATNVYMRGLKEKIQIVTNDGSMWLWRRICFTMKGDKIYQYQNAQFPLQLELSVGYVRSCNDWNNPAVNGSTTYPAQPQYITDVLFKGQSQQDWSNYFTAPLDTNRITVKYDKTTRIKSGNASGQIMTYNRWHGMNKSFNYDDDEAGGTQQGSAWSSQGKFGMGDYYVIDMFTAAPGTGSGSIVGFVPEATLYWHER